MFKKIICLGVILVMCLGILSGCGKDYKIDVGGEIFNDPPALSGVTRVMLDDDSFNRENKVKITVGFGFRSDDIRVFVASNAVVVLTIDAESFRIINEEGIESVDLYEKEFQEYTDNKFVCTKKNKRYIPNYYENFELKLNSNNKKTSGIIQISAIIHVGDGYLGESIRMYYCTSSNKISFSAKSIDDAKKKL